MTMRARSRRETFLRPSCCGSPPLVDVRLDAADRGRANGSGAVGGLGAVAVLVVPIGFAGVFRARALVGAVAKGLGVREGAAAKVFSLPAYCHWVWAAPRSPYDP